MFSDVVLFLLNTYLKNRITAIQRAQLFILDFQPNLCIFSPLSFSQNLAYVESVSGLFCIIGIDVGNS